MPLFYQVLGTPGRDNALLVRVESGQNVTRLLFDCGEGCLATLPFCEVHAIDQLFFSHLHMDHVGGFDSFFRANFDRDTRPNQVWGPPGTAAILQHRFQGYWWNLINGQQGTWRVNEVHANQIEHYRYELVEAFATTHHDGATPASDTILDHLDFHVSALRLQHHGVCLGYKVEETSRLNVQTDRLTALGLRPGAWLKQLKDEPTASTIRIGERDYAAAKLREELLVESPGESLAYLTDFLLDDATFAQLAQQLQGCDTLVCEAQYRGSDAPLATKNHHTTTRQVAELAAQANVGALILQHLSDRYTPPEWADMLREVRARYQRATFPADWKIEESTTSDASH